MRDEEVLEMKILGCVGAKDKRRERDECDNLYIHEWLPLMFRRSSNIYVYELIQYWCIGMQSIFHGSRKGMTRKREGP